MPDGLESSSTNIASDHGVGNGAALDRDDLREVGVGQAADLERGGGQRVGAARASLGVGPAQVVRQDRVPADRRRPPLASRQQRAARRRGGAAIVVRRDLGPGRSQVRPESYRPVPDRQRGPGGRARATRPASASGRERGGREQLAALAAQPGGGEHLAAARVEHGERPAAGLAAPAVLRRRPPAASAASVETPTSGRSRACASARAVAMPIRRPVKLPGPDADARAAPTSSQPDARRRASAVARPAPSSSRRVAGPLAGRRVVARSTASPRRRRAAATDGRRRRGVEAEDVHRRDASIRAAVAAGVLEAHAHARRALELGPRASGHSTNAIAVGPEVVVEQRRDPRRPAAASR